MVDRLSKLYVAEMTLTVDGRSFAGSAVPLAVSRAHFGVIDAINGGVHCQIVIRLNVSDLDH